MKGFLNFINVEFYDKIFFNIFLFQEHGSTANITSSFSKVPKEADNVRCIAFNDFTGNKIQSRTIKVQRESNKFVLII